MVINSYFSGPNKAKGYKDSLYFLAVRESMHRLALGGITLTNSNFEGLLKNIDFRSKHVKFS